MHLRNRSVSSPVSLPAIGLVGQQVRSLCHMGARGSVIIRFERCAYLQFSEQLVCIGLFELGASSISALFDCTVKELPQSLEIGASAQFSDERLIIDDRYFFDLGGAVLYVSAMQRDAFRFKTPTTQYGLIEKLTIPSSGLAPLLCHIAEATIVFDSAITVESYSVESYTFEMISGESELLGFTMPAIAQLAKQIRMNCDSGKATFERNVFEPASFQKLLGAGPGLTPSGDDFLCGVLVALRLCNFSDVAESLWASIRAVVMQSTTPVSAAMLEQSVLGESGERLESLIQAYSNYPLTAANDFQRLVDQIGETSGWDWLTGFVLCVDIVRHSQSTTSNGLD